MDIEKLKQVIQQANPDIMELKFGCYYEWGKQKAVELYDRQYQSEYYDCRCRSNSLAGQAFTNYRCKTCKANFVHPNTGVPMYCRDCAEQFEKCQFCGAHMRIIGRPIRLADVLVAIEKRPGPDMFFVAGHWPDGIKVTDSITFAYGAVPGVLKLWNLLDDNLDRQSDECKQFLYDLLVAPNK